MFRSIIAIVVGFVLIGFLAFAADALLHQFVPQAYDATGRMTSLPLLIFTQVYVAVFATFGCYLTARLAPSQPMRHALILGVLGLVFNIIGSIAQWDLLPVWYHITAIVLVMPYAWIGGRLRVMELERAAAAVRVSA